MSRLPAAAWACAAVAFLNALCWSLITPPLQGIDEPAHYSYVQELAQTGHLPSSAAPSAFSAEVLAALAGLHEILTRFKPQVPALSSRAEQRTLERYLSLPFAPVGALTAGTAGSEPPLYYALATVPYELGSSGGLLARVQLIRVLSALMAALAAAITFLFVREALPGAPWAWTVGALGVALMPVLGWIAGAVNPESTLVAASAALFYLLARAFRRGLTRRLAVAIGVVGVAGLLTKLNFVGLAPGLLVGLALLARRARREAALAAALVCAPLALYVLANLAAGKPALGAAASLHRLASESIPHELSYVWQLYLPSLPGMGHEFPGILTARQLWFDGLVGRFGWDDTFFPAWVYDAALVPAGLLVALGVRALVDRSGALAARRCELATYATMALGLLVLVGAGSYLADHPGGAPFWQPRYLLPLAPLMAAALALAVRGAGRRWGPLVGATVLVLLFAQDLFGQLQTIARYYG